MSKQKKKNNESKTQAIRHHTRFLERIAHLCDMLAGTGYYKKFHPKALEQMYLSRYPVLKAKAAPGSDIPKARIVQFNKLMNRFLDHQYISLYNGNKVLLSLYFSEGLILINYISAMKADYFQYAGQIREAFQDYFPGTESHEKLMSMLSTLVQDVTIFLSDMNNSIIKADVTQTACYDALSHYNDVLVYEFKTEKTSLNIEGEKRGARHLGWIDPDRKWVWSKVKPSSLGFETRSLDLPLDVYIQQHALDRLQERINITPGIMHSIVFLTLFKNKIEYYREANHSLVPYYISGQKAGYLLITLNDGRLVIRTFLFLTNDNTPEGRNLKRLIELEKEDKKHLEIDNLPAFNSYHFNENETLSKLFTDAGCGSLLRLGHLEEFTENETRDKDPESILKYIADAKYFMKQ